MLTDLAVRGLKTKDQRYMIGDGGGLYIEIVPNGHKYWWLRCSVAGKRKKFLLGKFPDLSLKDARKECILRRRDVDLSGGNAPSDITFKELAEDWFDKRMRLLSHGYYEKVKGRLEMYVYPFIGKRVAGTIKASDLLVMCRNIESEGYAETAHRVLSTCGQIFRYGVALGAIESDITGALRGALMPVSPEHFASVTKPDEVAQLMRSIWVYPHARVRNAMLFSAFTFCRPGEVRKAEWAEFDFLRREWRIPSERMKMKRPHLVPISTQVMSVLERQRALIDATGEQTKYVFPSERSPQRCMSENTVRIALRSIGYSANEMSAHGFRSMASTILNESGKWSADAIERQLAHVPGDDVRAAYNYAQFLPERIKMMQWYSDYLDEQRAGRLIQSLAYCQ